MEDVKSIYTFNNIPKEIVSKDVHIFEISKIDYIIVQFILITKPRISGRCYHNSFYVK